MAADPLAATTDPAQLVEAAAARFGAALAIEDGDTRSRSRSWPAQTRRAARRVPGGGRRARRSRRDLGAELRGVGRRGDRSPVRRRRARAAQHALQGREAGYVLRKSRARVLFTVGEFLGTRYVESLAGEDLPDLERIVLLRGDASDPRVQSWDAFLAGRRRDLRDGAARPRGRGLGRRSLRPPLHLGHDRHAEGRDDDARAEPARLRDLDRGRRPARGRPLPDREPVLPLLRLQGRLARLPDARRDDATARRLRRGRRARPHRARAHLGAARSADALPVDARAPGSRERATSRRCASP